MLWLTLLMLAFAATAVRGQATAQSSVAPELRECYTDTKLLNRNNLPPTTMPVLIDIIRKIEDNPNINLDLRMLATQVLHTYRQDGIVYHQRNTPVSSIVLPYAPTFHSFHRNKLVLRMIPSNQQTLPNNTLNSELKCAIHHILSTTVDSRVRGDDSSCGQLSQYRALRTARSIDDDVETLDFSKLNSNKNGQIQQLDGEVDVEFMDAKSGRQTDTRSACPILTGVVNTHWGPVSAGNLIAGIAAGAENQRISIQELVKDLNPHNNYDRNAQSSITSIYPATLSGDLAEAILIQGTGGQTSIAVGNVGNWNSSQATKFYMLSSNNNVEMTDPEIRGGLDGFLLGATLANSINAFRSLKLSQLLDMYYTPANGVFNPELRACNRRSLSQQYITTANLVSETRGFVSALDAVLPLQGTLIDGLDGLVTSAITNFQTYTNNNLNDLNCETTSTTRSVTRTKTNLFLMLDSTWAYDMIYPAITYLIEALEVGKYGSSITLLSALDGGILINKTFSPSDFHTQYTRDAHISYMNGVDLQVSFAAIREIIRQELKLESDMDYVGGNSSVLLFLLNSNVVNNQNTYEQARQLNNTAPDLRVLFAANLPNQQDNLANLVQDVHNDIRTIALTSSGTGVDEVMRPIVDIIQNLGRRIINPNCGPDLNGPVSGQKQVTEYLEPGYVNFYRISPNYFYNNNENTRVRVSRTGTAIGNLVVCHSRFVSLPRQNNNSNIVQDEAVTCQTLLAAGNVDISLQGYCDTSSPIGSCSPLYFSVESVIPATVTGFTATCTNANACRYPYEIAYNIQINDFGCYSSGFKAASSLLFVLLGVIINMLRN